MSIHPTMTNEEAHYITEAIKQVAENHQVWAKDYKYDSGKNEFIHKTVPALEENIIKNWFEA